MSSAIAIHGPVVSRRDRDPSHASRPSPTVRRPTLMATPAIHTTVIRPMTVDAGPPDDSTSRAEFDESDPAAVGAMIGEGPAGVIRRSGCWRVCTGDPNAMCHEGTISSKAGNAAAHTRAADKIQCRRAAERFRIVIVAASATSTITEAFIAILPACLYA